MRSSGVWVRLPPAACAVFRELFLTADCNPAVNKPVRRTTRGSIPPAPNLVAVGSVMAAVPENGGQPPSAAILNSK
jgi:hypothetical protein